MEALRFELSGRAACFHKPDANVNAYFTFSHIHKVALYGLLGAIRGYSGYTTQFVKKSTYPQFYERLKLLRVSVVPHGERGYFTKKIQIFNNAVGYASNEQNNILNVREQWIENPHWTIYVYSQDGEGQAEYDALCETMFARSATYIPYLGKNDHPAKIDEVTRITMTPGANGNPFDSILPIDAVKKCYTNAKLNQGKFYWREFLPDGLHEEHKGYTYKQFIHTGYPIDIHENWLSSVWIDDLSKRSIVFF